MIDYLLSSRPMRDPGTWGLLSEAVLLPLWTQRKMHTCIYTYKKRQGKRELIWVKFMQI